MQMNGNQAEETASKPRETFACEQCVKKLEAGGRDMWPTSGEKMGYCQHGQYVHKNPVAGKWYGYTTREERAAARRKAYREKYAHGRPSGGGERARAGRGD